MNRIEPSAWSSVFTPVGRGVGVGVRVGVGVGLGVNVGVGVNVRVGVGVSVANGLKPPIPWLRASPAL